MRWEAFLLQRLQVLLLWCVYACSGGIGWGFPPILGVLWDMGFAVSHDMQHISVITVNEDPNLPCERSGFPPALWGGLHKIETLHVVENQERGSQPSGNYTGFHSHASSAPHPDRELRLDQSDRRSHVTWKLFSGEAGKGLKEAGSRRAQPDLTGAGDRGHCTVCIN